MPSASSPPPVVAMPSSPKASTGPSRPALLKRHSSHASTGQRQTAREAVASPGSHPEGQHALRHPVRNNKHARIVLPRNHSSGRNLAKMARQATAAQDSNQRQQHGRNRSHENDTEIRLPGSLDESSPAQQQMQQRPPMRRNMTSYHLSRNASHTKLKKNHSHGQLQRLNSKGNLASMGQTNNRAPPSPGLKGRNKRPKSADMSKWALEKDLHEQEVELAQRLAEKRAGASKKVGFAVGSSGDSDDEETIADMEGAGMEEGDWTEESTSASPYSTRQNTANNSRRASVVQERPPNRAPLATNVMVSNEAQQPPKSEAVAQSRMPEVQTEGNGTKVAGTAVEDDEDETETETEDEDAPPSPRSPVKSRPQVPQPSAQPVQEPRKETQLQAPHEPLTQSKRSPQKVSQAPRSPLHAAKEHPNPTMPLLRNASGTSPAPAMTSNVNAMDNSHSIRGSPANSTMSGRSTLAGSGDQDELVSRFIPSTSHPNTGSNPTTTQNTPKTTHFHTPEADSNMHRHNRGIHSRHQSQPDPVSPGNSTISGSSGTATPSIGRSRIELKMLQEKAMADIHSVVDRNPFIPAHVYDRRNESLKSYLNLAALNNNNTNNNNLQLAASNVTTNSLATTSSNLSLGPEIFQGRFKAVHTELRVVQKFRDPLAESIARLRACKGSKVPGASPQKLHAAALRTSKSAVSLPSAAAGKARGGLHSRAVSGAAAEKGLSGSPLKNGGPVGGTGSAGPSPAGAGLQSSKSSVNVQQQGQGRRQGQRGVSFAGGEEASGGAGEEGESADVVARRMWADFASGGAGAVTV